MESNTLELMFHRQHGLQSHITGMDVLDLPHAARMDYIRYNVLALTDELHEALKEVSWKPWAEGHRFNREAYLKELVDALHFLMNLALAAGADGVTDLVREFTALYFHKADVNQRRKDEGYDGISTKCACGREIRDGISGQVTTSGDAVIRVFSCPCGRFNGLIA